MLWRVRALLQDRPGALSALTADCGAHGANILGLQFFPGVDGVVDDLVIHTPEGWTTRRVEQLVTRSGASDPRVSECSVHVLQDEVQRYVRAARTVMEQPGELEAQLCDLLDATGVGADGDLDSLVLDDVDGHPVVLRRAVPFTDTERGRAMALQQVALGSTTTLDPTDVRPVDAAEPVLLRSGSADDAAALAAMHARCSAETVYRRYHAAMPHLSPARARAVLQPRSGWSTVMTVGDDVVAAAMVTDDGAGRGEVGLIVEDRWQRRGLGVRLLRSLAIRAAEEGLRTLVFLVQADNDAVLSTIQRGGLRARATRDGDRLEIEVRLAGTAARPRTHGNKPSVGELTAPLVALLHQRGELREVYPAASVIDHTIRGGA